MSGGLYITDFLTLAQQRVLLYPFINPECPLIKLRIAILPIGILPAVCARRDYCSAKVRLRSVPAKAGPCGGCG